MKQATKGSVASFGRTLHHTTFFSVVLIAGLLLAACAPIAPMSTPSGGAPAGGWEEAAPAPAAESAARPASADEPAAELAAPAARPQHNSQFEPVTAGVVDDNAQWDAYLDYRSSRRQRFLYVNDRDVSERYLIHVWNGTAHPVHDAQVTIYAGDDELFAGRTDAGGQLLFHPNALDSGSRQQEQGRTFRVVAQKGWVAQSRTFTRSDDEHWTLTLENPPSPGPTQLDLLFLVDATGSMDDEIDKLKNSMADIADQLARLPEMPDVRYGLVAYRDQGDDFVVRAHDFTGRLEKFQRTLAELRANGGGDEPEALNEALHTAIHGLSWREDDTVRMIVLVGDAPPHLDYNWEPFSYDTDMFAAVGRGIKIFPVGASNLNDDGEYVFRQLAQVTGGKFVFLTYKEGSDPSSGPGTETEHDVDNYSVDTLDRLIVRLVREELAKLSSSTALQPDQQQSRQSPTQPETTPLLSCAFVPGAETESDCIGLEPALIVMEPALLRLTLDPERTGYSRVRFDIDYDQPPIGYSVHIGDSISNNGDAGDYGDQSNDAELQVVDGTLAIFASDSLPAGQNRLLSDRHGMVGAGDTLTVEIADGMVEVAGDMLTSPYLFALHGQPDKEGSVNYDLYAAFNRTVTGERMGIGVSLVTVTLYPAQ